jgi:hypothetical protein
MAARDRCGNEEASRNDDAQRRIRSEGEEKPACLSRESCCDDAGQNCGSDVTARVQHRKSDSDAHEERQSMNSRRKQRPAEHAEADQSKDEGNGGHGGVLRAKS